MSEACVFCRIARGEIESKKVLEDDAWIAFRDIQPQAPIHVLVAPRRHHSSLVEAAVDEPEILGRLLAAAVEVARREGLEASGFRVVVNTRESAGQSVAHLHLHVLGGRRFAWPPG